MAAKKTTAKKDTLGAYRKKRDFAKTPEPAGKVVTKPKSRGRLFVIQKHDARNLHYDFRIEVGGVLKSWAIPKGPSMDPKNKRLAVQTEDHPYDYALFEGIIPEGQYGGGTVMVWDTGEYHNLKLNADASEVPMEQTLEEGKIEIWLEGKKLRGAFALVRTRMMGKQEQWLFFKVKDALAKSGDDIINRAPDSALTGRTLDEIAAEGKVYER